MRTSMTFSTSAQSQVINNATSAHSQVTNNFVALVSQPVRVLAAYYSHILERRISCRQMWLLLNAQLAFFLTVFTSCSLVLRTICLIWLVLALLQCKTALSTGQQTDCAE